LFPAGCTVEMKVDPHDRLRIAFLTTEYATEENFHGGLANYLRRTARALLERGHEPEIFIASTEMCTFVQDGVIVHRVAYEGSISRMFDALTRSRLTQARRILLLSRALKRAFATRHARKPFHIVQSSSYLSPGYCLSRFRPVPVVTRLSSYEPLWSVLYGQKRTLDQRLKEYFEIVCLRRSDAVYAPSAFLSRIVRKETSIPVDVVRPPFVPHIPATEEPSAEDPLGEKRYLLFFGSLGLLKGGEALAASLPALLGRYPDLHFAVAGKVFHGPREGISMLEHIRGKSGVHKDRIINLGILSPSGLYPVIRRAEAVVLPSLADNFPNTMLEAMSLGKVVVGAEGASFEEMIEDGVSGLLVKPGDPSSLLGAMEKAWNMSREERNRIGNNARERVSFLSPDRTCPILVEYFRRLL